MFLNGDLSIMNNIDSYLLLVFGTIGVLISLLLWKFEWEKYKSGTPYGVTNHARAVILTCIFFIILLSGLLRILV